MTQQHITKEDYQDEVEAQIHDIDVEIEKLKAIGDQVTMDARVEYTEDLERLTALREQLEARLDDFKLASQSAWRDTLEPINAVLIELQYSVEDAVTRFYNTETAQNPDKNQ